MVQEVQIRKKLLLRINFDLISACSTLFIFADASNSITGIINLSKETIHPKIMVVNSGISLMGLFLVSVFTVSSYKKSNNQIDQRTMIYLNHKTKVSMTLFKIKKGRIYQMGLEQLLTSRFSLLTNY